MLLTRGNCYSPPELCGDAAVDPITAWDANTQIEALPITDPRSQIGACSGGSLSSFSLGYRTSSAFFRDLVQRLVHEKNMPFMDALREVQIGAMEGWYGIGFGGASYGQGLVPRMRARFGQSWSPVQAMLGPWRIVRRPDPQPPLPGSE